MGRRRRAAAPQGELHVHSVQVLSVKAGNRSNLEVRGFKDYGIVFMQKQCGCPLLAPHELPCTARDQSLCAGNDRATSVTPSGDTSSSSGDEERGEEEEVVEGKRRRAEVDYKKLNAEMFGDEEEEEEEEEEGSDGEWD